MAKLADALDLGSSGLSMGVQVPSPAPIGFNRNNSCFFVMVDPLDSYLRPLGNNIGIFIGVVILGLIKFTFLKLYMIIYI